jgi:hypothetical protein
MQSRLKSKVFEKLAKRVDLTNPGGGMLSRKQFAVLAVGTCVMVVVGWMLEAAVKWAVGWLVGAILKVKLG